MYSLYDAMKMLRNVYTQLAETAIKEGNPLAYTDDRLMSSIIEYVTEKEGEEENSNENEENAFNLSDV